MLRRAGAAVTVLEKSRGIGGRLATRRARDGLAFDHGAEAAHGAGPAWEAFVAAAEAAGDAAPWNGGATGAPGMNVLPRSLAAGLDIRFGAEAVSVVERASGVRVVLAGGEAMDADFAIVTAPAPQTARICADLPAIAAPAGAARMSPCWAVLAAWPADAPVGAAPEAPLAAAFRMADKPGRAAAPARWVGHAGAAFSAESLETEREAILPALLPPLAAAAGADPAAASYAAAHRWRYARVEAAVGAPCLATARVVAAGDWLLGADAGCAFESGVAAAAAALDPA